MLETKTVARNTRSCENVAEQLVEIPNPKATEGFIWKEIASPPGLLERKNNKIDVSFSTFFFNVYAKEDNRGRARASD